jgi:hypothetical protein
VAAQGGPGAVSAATDAFLGAFNEILLIGGIVALVGALVGVLLTRDRDLVAQGAPEAAVAQEGAAREPVAA